MNINYPDKPEYEDWERDLINKGIRKYYGDRDVEIHWYKQNDPINYIDKIDGSIIVLKDEHITHAQVKKSGYPKTFTVGEMTLLDYMAYYHNIEALIIAFLNHGYIYFFNWFQFVDLARETVNYWPRKKGKRGYYRVIPLDDLVNNIAYRKVDIK